VVFWMVRVHVVIDGIVSGGKSIYREEFERRKKPELEQLVGSDGTVLFLPEWRASNEELAHWSAGIGKKATGIDYEKLHFDGRTNRHREQISPIHKGVVVEERDFLAGIAYFLPALHELGVISEQEMFQYQATVFPQLDGQYLPDIRVCINVDPETAHQRLLEDETRSQDERNNYSPEYLQALSKHFQTFMGNGAREWHRKLGAPAPIIIVANNHFPNHEVPDSTGRICDEIMEAIRVVYQKKGGERYE
jgi:thymidylate kinase